MYDFAVTWDWIEFVVRWLHVITAIVWVGTSFYFIALDLGPCAKDRTCPRACMARNGRCTEADFTMSGNTSSLQSTCRSI